MIPSELEVDKFIEHLCEVSLSSKEFKRVSKQFLTLCITALQSVTNSTKQDNASAAIGILRKLENRTELSSIQENVQLSQVCRSSRRSTGGNRWQGRKSGFQFDHPLITDCKKGGNCGFVLKYEYDDAYEVSKLVLRRYAEDYEETGIHFHDEIDADDIYFYHLWSINLRCQTNTSIQVKVPSRRWFKWFTQTGHLLLDWKMEHAQCEYNIKNYLALKSQCRKTP